MRRVKRDECSEFTVQQPSFVTVIETPDPIITKAPKTRVQPMCTEQIIQEVQDIVLRTSPENNPRVGKTLSKNELYGMQLLRAEKEDWSELFF